MNSTNRIDEASCGRRSIAAALKVRSLAILVTGLAALTTVITGCGYNIGAPFQAEIQSVHVPIFTSTSYRRNLEYQLTEAVQKEIQKQSHFKVVKEPHADTRLTGHIIDVRKERLGENGYDDPRELQMQFSVEVTWEDLRTGQILMQNRIPISPEAVRLLSTADFAPELGQSQATATQEAIDRMARQIVQMMETPW